jgi:hypothetical protein
MWQDVITEAHEEQALCEGEFVSLVLSKKRRKNNFCYFRFLGQSKSRPFPTTQRFPLSFGRLGLLRQSVRVSAPTAMTYLWAASVGG